jgi:hypothetical protein
VAQGLDERTGSPQLTGLHAALDALADRPAALLSGAERLAQLKDALRLEARLHTRLALELAGLDAAEIAWQEHGTSTATWLADAANLTRREAGQLIAAGEGLTRFAIVAEAASAGSVLPAQSEAITHFLDDLPDDFPTDVVREAKRCWSGSPPPATASNCAGSPLIWSRSSTPPQQKAAKPPGWNGNSGWPNAAGT